MTYVNKNDKWWLDQENWYEALYLEFGVRFTELAKRVSPERYEEYMTCMFQYIHEDPDTYIKKAQEYRSELLVPHLELYFRENYGA